MTELGHGTQVVQVLDDHTYQLDENLLKKVLLKEEVKDLPVVVISVAGAYRGGKSFLLNFFLRYLTSPLSAQQDGSWLGEDSEPLVGFNWRGGPKRNTTGILLWSEPYVTTISSGEKVAVLLMDTQGTFDSSSTVRDNSTIFALSTLISSVQIYNLSMNIQEDDLQHLQLFTMYGKMVQDKNIGGKAFQTLEFLVRDWPYPYDYAFGVEGGSQILEDRLKITPDQPKELRELRTHIRSSFEKVLCFLMPHPGFKVQSPNFKGNISDIEPNFREHLKVLVTSLLSSNNLCPKVINGQNIKSGELFNYFKSYMSLFNSDQIPNPTNIMQATVEASLLSSMNESRGVYEQGMDLDCGPTKLAVTVEDIKEIHRKYLDVACTTFRNKKTMASPEEINNCLTKLNKELENRLPQFEQSNLSKIQTVLSQAQNKYMDTIRSTHKHQELCLHPSDLKKVHEEAIQAALILYDSNVKNISNKTDQKRVEVIQSFNDQYIQLKIINDKNNKDIVKSTQEEYWKYMETKSVHPPIPDMEFKKEHDRAKTKALDDFTIQRNRPNHYPNDIYKEDLDRTIMDSFSKLRTINLRKIEQEKIRLEQEQRRIEQERISAEQERIKKEQERIRAEQERIAMEQQIRAMEQENERIRIQNSLRRSSSSSSGRCVLI